MEAPPGESPARRCRLAGGGRSLQLSVCAAAEGVDEVKVKAVNEMMERIKHGVVLRPVKSQDAKVRGPSERSAFRRI